uniref:Reverse transcriptase Ty1/copia-type domain-containing protein n=1 Tax=Tanacetum cinerariifolium TaxID=118510 RepID=A0A699GME6_TANCI|nr:hypothetical protein [Tanacetum cinerariifolium]
MRERDGKKYVYLSTYHAPKPKIPPPPKREDPTKDSICYECGETRHWKRNYPQYLAKFLKKKKNAASGSGGSGIFVIELLSLIDHRSMTLVVDYALETAARILNMVTTKKVEKIRYKIWHGQALKLSYLNVSGCEALVKQDTLTKLEKLEPRSIKCIFIGYPKEIIDLESKKWLNAMNVEIQSMKDNEVWVLVELPPNGKIETFSTVADIRAIRILIAIAAYYDYEIWQMDVKTAFLNGYLNEEVYIEQHEGFVNPNIQTGCFAMKDLGEDAYILGIKIYRDRSWWLIGLCLSAYIEKILKRYYMENSKRGIYEDNLKQDLKVSCYIDAGYLTDADDLKSHTGYVFVLNGGAVYWKSAKQSIFATSSAEAEYIAASKEAVWVIKFIYGLGAVPTIEELISMYIDNAGAIAIANEPGITIGARHFRAKVYYFREVIKYGDVKLERVHTDENLADPFTKALDFQNIQNILGILECF